jgi:hypothetical protein
MRRTLTILCSLALTTACYRTHYVNFSPANPNRSPQSAQPVKRGSGWQHFFIYGWVPSELTVDARSECGSAENVDSIQTRQTFLEGLVGAVAGFYINIYAPWDGAVYCRQAPVTLAPAAPPAAPAAQPAPAP